MAGRYVVDRKEIEIDTKKGLFFRYPPNALEKYDIILGIAPTGSGKTTSTLKLIAPYVRRGLDPSSAVLHLNPQVIIALPTKAACTDVAEAAAQMYGDNSVIIDNSDTKAMFGRAIKWNRPIVVTTYEKLAIVLAHSPGVAKNKVIVLDEFHMITDPERAVNIDIVVSTIMRNRDKNGWKSKIIGLSATFPEVNKVVDYFSHYGNVLLIEGKEPQTKIMWWFGNDLDKYRESFVFIRGRGRFAAEMRRRIDTMMSWLNDLVSKGINPYPVLIYIPNKGVINMVYNYLIDRYGIPKDEIVYHHADLDPEEKYKVLMELKKPDTKIKFVLATDTLAMSVNTVVKSVVMPLLTSKGAQGEYKPSPTRIRQIIGRAGRPGLSGDRTAYVLAFYSDEEEKSRFEKAIRGEYETIAFPNDGFKLLLYIVRLKLDYRDYARYSLLAYPDKIQKLEEMLKDAEREAIRSGLIMEKEGDLILSPLGSAMSSMLFTHEKFVAILGVAIRFYHEKKMYDLSSMKPEDRLWEVAVRSVLPPAVAKNLSCSRVMSWLRNMDANKLEEYMNKANDSAIVSEIGSVIAALCLDAWIQVSDRLGESSAVEECVGEVKTETKGRANEICYAEPNYASFSLLNDKIVFTELLGNNRFEPYTRREVANMWVDVLKCSYYDPEDKRLHACVPTTSMVYALDRIHVPSSENILQTATRLANVLAVALGEVGDEKTAKAFAIAAKFVEYIAYIKAQVVIKKTMRYTEAKERQDMFFTFAPQIFGFEDWKGVLKMSPKDVDKKITMLLAEQLAEKLGGGYHYGGKRTPGRSYWGRGRRKGPYGY